MLERTCDISTDCLMQEHPLVRDLGDGSKTIGVTGSDMAAAGYFFSIR